MPRNYVTNQRDMVDAICRRFYGSESGVVERVLDANPGLADLGAVLPAGITIKLPDAPTTRAEIPIIALWD